MDTALSASAKLVWLLLQLTAGSSAASLHATSRLAETTIHRAVRELKRMGWLPATARRVAVEKPRATIPAELLLDRRVGIQGKLLYGIVQLTPGFGDAAQRFSYGSLSVLTGACVNTVKRAIRALHQAGWLQVERLNKSCPMKLTLRNPEADRYKHAVAGISRRWRKSQHKGEALMREYLSRIIVSSEYRDNASPTFLLNPYTGEKMQFDRYYPAKVAFEYNGPQHYTTTERYPDQHQLRKQRARDHMKAGICRDQGLPLLVVHAEDLSFATLRQKVADLGIEGLRLRAPGEDERLIAYLDRLSRSHQKEAAAGARRWTR